MAGGRPGHRVRTGLSTGDRHLQWLDAGVRSRAFRPIACVLDARMASRPLLRFLTPARPNGVRLDQVTAAKVIPNCSRARSGVLITPPVGRVDWARQHGVRTSATAPHPSWMNTAPTRTTDASTARWTADARMPMHSGEGVTGPAPTAGPSHRLAGTGTRILLLGRGGWMPRERDDWGLHGDVRPREVPGVGVRARPAALFRLRPEDFGDARHHGGLSPAGSRALAQLAAGRHPSRRARRDDVPPVRQRLDT